MPKINFFLLPTALKSIAKDFAILRQYFLDWRTRDWHKPLKHDVFDVNIDFCKWTFLFEFSSIFLKNNFFWIRNCGKKIWGLNHGRFSVFSFFGQKNFSSKFSQVGWGRDGVGGNKIYTFVANLKWIRPPQTAKLSIKLYSHASIRSSKKGYRRTGTDADHPIN